MLHFNGIHIGIIYWNHGKENGNYFVIIGLILGLYSRIMKKKWKLLYHNRVHIGNHGKESGNYYIIIGFILGLYIGVL